MEIKEKNIIESPYKILESIEKKAWIDIYKAASRKTAENLGIKYLSFNSVKASIASSVDVLALNRVLGFESAEDLSEGLLKEIIQVYKGNNISRFFLQVHPGLLTEEISARLNSLGFTFYNNWVKLYRDNSPVKDIESDLVVEQTGKHEAKDFADILIKSFEWDDKLYKWFFDFVQRDNWIHYLGYFKNKPIAAASMFIEGEFAWLGFAATLKEHRNLGAQHALIRQRFIDGLNNGCRHFIAETAEDKAEKKSQSSFNLVDMGFKKIYSRPNYIFYC